MTIYARPKLENAIFSNFQGASSWESMYESLWKSKILHAIDQKNKIVLILSLLFCLRTSQSHTMGLPIWRWVVTTTDKRFIFTKMLSSRKKNLFKKVLLYRFEVKSARSNIRWFLFTLLCFIYVLRDNAKCSLTHSFPVHLLSTPWKHQTTLRFSDFSGVRERMHWERMR